VSLISKLKAVVAGDEYLDNDFDDLDYASEDELNNINNFFSFLINSLFLCIYFNHAMR